MSRIRPYVRGARSRRLATAGVAATAATLLAAALSPAAGAADRPTRATAVANAAAVLADHASALGLGSAQRTKVRDVIVDPDGTQHVRYDRTYRQLPVLGGDFVVHLAPDGAYKSSSRATRSAISLSSVTPALSAPKAADLAANALKAANLGETLKKLTAKPRLVVDALHGAPRLAWQTDAAAQDSLGNPVARTVLTDARTGAQIDAWDSIEQAAGDGKSLYSGTVSLETTQSGSTYQLKDATRGNTYTGDAANKTDLCFLTICFSRAPAHPVHRRRQPLGHGGDFGPGHGGGGRAVRDRRHLGLLQERPRAERDRRGRQGLLQPRPLRQQLQQRLLGRQLLLHDVRRR
ncbi:Zn-dependent metalloprotease [Streptomyces sp. SAI-133]|nr:Zn-dependent metalloprotease [Streptomyces sp. SAI-133]